MKYYLVAGEASGDLHGANLIKALKTEDPGGTFRFFGGDKMQAEGGTLVKHYADMAFMGFTEVVMNLRTILRNLKTCKQDILNDQPDVLILIDFPGFNLKIAEFAKSKGIRVCYYISPKVWAWNQKRVLKIKKVVDKLFCILPFETDFYQKWGMQVDYVGNPLLDEKAAFTPQPGFSEANGLGTELIALLPGSRQQEIERLLPDMISIIPDFPGYQFAVAAAPGFSPEYYARFIGQANVKLIFGQTYDLLQVAAAAVVASGTATLETALFQVPQVVVYRGGKLTIAIARLLVKIRFISLVNLIMDRAIVKELIQEECSPANISRELRRLITGPGRSQLLDDYRELSVRMGGPGASARTAALIVNYLRS